jgi:hypothetical protein
MRIPDAAERFGLAARGRGRLSDRVLVRLGDSLTFDGLGGLFSLTGNS